MENRVVPIERVLKGYRGLFASERRVERFSPEPLADRQPEASLEDPQLSKTLLYAECIGCSGRIA